LTSGPMHQVISANYAAVATTDQVSIPKLWQHLLNANHDSDLD
jgi:hypothetical protein